MISMPPYLIRIGIYNQHRRLGMWFPLFLLWPLVAALALILFPIVLLIAIVFWYQGWSWRVLMVGPAILACLCNLRGLSVEYQQYQERFILSLK